MKHLLEKNNEMKISKWLLPKLMVTLVAIVLGLAAPKPWAHGEIEKVELDEAEIFFEENATDKDLGIQFFLDGEAWKWIRIIGPKGRTLLNISARGNAGELGLAELFSESSEPTYVAEDDEPPEITRPELLALFPPGVYHFLGLTVEGEWLGGTTVLTQDIPCAPEIEVVAEDGTVTVEWDAVTTVVDPDWQPEDEDDEQDCIQPPSDFEIVGYEAVFELEAEVSGEERVFVNTANLPASATAFTASPEFVAAAGAFIASGELLEAKVEVIAIEASGNKGITEEILFPVDD